MALKLKQVGLIFNSPLQQHSSDELLWASEERALQTGDSGCFTQGANADQGHISARSCPTTGMAYLAYCQKLHVGGQLVFIFGQTFLPIFQ